MAAAVTALLVMALLAVDWLLRRARVARACAPAPRQHWQPAAAEAPPHNHDWLALGYTPLGSLAADGAAVPELAVYAHPELPIYACTRLADGTPFLVSYFDDGGQVITTAAPLQYETFTWTRDGAPRLVQLRRGGSPTALDGQHAGTVRAWLGGRRKPRPATREALPEYLEQDRDLVRRELAALDWLPLPVYFRTLIGQPPGVLRF